MCLLYERVSTKDRKRCQKRGTREKWAENTWKNGEMGRGNEGNSDGEKYERLKGKIDKGGRGEVWGLQNIICKSRTSSKILV